MAERVSFTFLYTGPVDDWPEISAILSAVASRRDVEDVLLVTRPAHDDSTDVPKT